jgi:OOP family OmpA-OmpF porin
MIVGTSLRPSAVTTTTPIATRNSRQFFYGLGVGKFISSNVAIELFVDRTKRKADSNVFGQGNTWSNNNYGVAARYFFGDWNSWRPYLLGGVMGSLPPQPARQGLGSGCRGWRGYVQDDHRQRRLPRGSCYRYDWDDKTLPQRERLRRLVPGLQHRCAHRRRAGTAAPVAPPPAAAPDCSKQFRNGVNLCDNKCPDLPEGTIVGPDGCPQKVVIDLKGVNFKFDRPKKGETNIEPTWLCRAATRWRFSTRRWIRCSVTRRCT